MVDVGSSPTRVSNLNIPCIIRLEVITMTYSKGKKAQGQPHFAKLVNPRHGHGPKRGCNAVEKAAETKVRQSGKKACQDRQ